MVTITKQDAVEIEVDSATNSPIFFLPAQRHVRGRFDYLRVAEPKAKMKMGQFNNQPLPGQRIGFDFGTGKGYIAESLRDDENSFLRETVASLGQRVPESEEFEAVDEVTWLYWMYRAVKAGHARLVKGELPDTFDGEPQKHFFDDPPKESPTDKLAAAIEKQNALLAKQTDALTALLTKLAGGK